MKLTDFVKKYNGSKVDYDKMYGCQCVDLFRQYCKDVLQIPHTGGVEGAKDLYEKYNDLPLEQKYFTKITHHDFCIYSAGDVAIWGATQTNKYGHVAIIIADMNDCLVVFEQDGFKQNGAKITIRDKTNMLGVLRVM